jgi:hypothetical protein
LLDFTGVPVGRGQSVPKGAPAVGARLIYRAMVQDMMARDRERAALRTSRRRAYEEMSLAHMMSRAKEADSQERLRLARASYSVLLSEL